MVGGIYQIKNQMNGKRYIGSAVNLRKRQRDHLRELRQGKHGNRHLQAAFRKYGVRAFSFSTLEHVAPEKLIGREQHYLDTLKPEYNLCPTAGSMLGYRHTAETRARISGTCKGRRPNNYGKHLSMETRAKMSASHKGKHPNNYGKSPSAEARAKLSKVLKGKRSFFYGKHHSAEAKAKISEAATRYWRRFHAAQAAGPV